MRIGFFSTQYHSDSNGTILMSRARRGGHAGVCPILVTEFPRSKSRRCTDRRQTVPPACMLPTRCLWRASSSTCGGSAAPCSGQFDCLLQAQLSHRRSPSERTWRGRRGGRASQAHVRYRGARARPRRQRDTLPRHRLDGLDDSAMWTSPCSPLSAPWRAARCH